MKFKIFSELSYEVLSPTTFIFNIQAARSASQLILEESLLITPDLPFEEFALDAVDARFIKMAADKGKSFTIKYEALVNVQYRVVEETSSLVEIPVLELDREIIPFLFPSRHCQSDKLRKLAEKKFGKYENAYAKVAAINEWIFSRTDYISGVTDSGTSAFDTIIQSEGVCKDFAHLGIALCRALDIPARYVTGYAYKIFPADFHACFEAYIGGHWIFFDPTKLIPANGLVKIANCRDAGDAAVASFFGSTNCTYMKVQCDTVDDDFKPFIPANGTSESISYQLSSQTPAAGG